MPLFYYVCSPLDFKCVQIKLVGTAEQLEILLQLLIGDCNNEFKDQQQLFVVDCNMDKTLTRELLSF